MHNIQSRANAVFSTFVSVMFSVLGAIALSGLVYLHFAQSPSASLTVKRVET